MGEGSLQQSQGSAAGCRDQGFVERDLAARLRRHEGWCEQELVWVIRQRDNVPAKPTAISLLFDRSRSRSNVAVDLNAQVTSTQLTLFADLGLADPGTAAGDLAKALEIDRKREIELEALAAPAVDVVRSYRTGSRTRERGVDRCRARRRPMRPLVRWANDHGCKALRRPR